jgi:hypothetical protein
MACCIIGALLIGQLIAFWSQLRASVPVLALGLGVVLASALVMTVGFAAITASASPRIGRAVPPYGWCRFILPNQ